MSPGASAATVAGMSLTSAPTPTLTPLSSGTALAARDLTRRFGEVTALDALSLELREGELASVVGPARSGKSTLLELLGGLDSPSSGSVEVEGVELGRLGDRQLAQLRRRRIGLVLPTVGLVPGLSAAENVLLPLRLARRSPEFGFFEDVLERAGLADVRWLRPVEMTLDERRRTEVARALVTEPAVVLADEPTAGLAPDAAYRLLDLLHEAAAGHGQAVLLATRRSDVAASASRIHHLDGGELAA